MSKIVLTKVENCWISQTSCHVNHKNVKKLKLGYNRGNITAGLVNFSIFFFIENLAYKCGKMTAVLVITYFLILDFFFRSYRNKKNNIRSNKILAS